MYCHHPPVSDAGTGMADLKRGGSQCIARPRMFVSVHEERYEACHHYDFLVCLWNRLIFFFELFKLYFHLGLVTTPHVLHVHMTYDYSLCFNHMAKRSHYCIMIFSTSEFLFYGRIPSLIFFHFLHNPTTPILPIYVDQQRPDLEKDTTWPRGVI